MLLSMTSYGRASESCGEKNIVIEIKTLNSKYLDLRLKAPSNLQERELVVRKRINDQLTRGKIEVNISYETADGAEFYSVNKDLFGQYLKEIKTICEENQLSTDNVVGPILRLPEVVSSAEGKMTEAEWLTMQNALKSALDLTVDHRKTEGAAMQQDLEGRIARIQQALERTADFEAERKQLVRDRLQQNLDEFAKTENVDQNRFEQELFYYLDKIDINEEKVRLAQHCDYFLEVLGDEKELVKGRKLSFISQEMGREINTLGAKAYSSKIQKIVVQMKDDLEKIKEQVSNAL